MKISVIQGSPGVVNSMEVMLTGFLACDCEAVTHAIVIDVCPSVCLSNAWIVTKRKHLAQKFNYD